MLELGWILSAVFLALFCVGFWWSLRFFNPYGIRGVVHLVGVVICMSVLQGLCGYFAAIKRAPRVIQIMKTWRLCPGCAYALDGVARHGEGLVTCPECGAKWRLDEGPTP